MDEAKSYILSQISQLENSIKENKALADSADNQELRDMALDEISVLQGQIDSLN